MSTPTMSLSDRDPYAILVDVTRCTGCESCVAACVEANALDASAAEADGATTRDGLSANRLVTLTPFQNGRWVRRSCMHCDDPSCVAACLVGGLTKRPDGPVVYDADACIGCRYCMLACPWHIPRYEWSERFPFMKKCSLCADRLDRNREPACVAACPHEALAFGRRSEMVRVAARRLAEQPNHYLPEIWGQTEWGGASLLYISDVDLAPLGLGRASSRSIPSRTDPIIHATPHVAIGVASALVGLNWIIGRRTDVAAAESSERERDNA
jgi:formate dehydrogenase iron-sulfur subunit